MKTMKVFISQPMNGVSEEEIQKVREDAKADIQNLYGAMYTLEFLNSYITEDAPAVISDAQKPVWYLGKSLEKMAEADIIYFCKGFDHAKGCNIEKIVSDSYYGAYKICIYNHQYVNERGESWGDASAPAKKH